MKILCQLLSTLVLCGAVLGCGLFGNEPSSPEMDLYFEAKVNGNPWSGKQNYWRSANMSWLKKNKFLSVGAVHTNSTTYPYFQSINIFLPPEKEDIPHTINGYYHNPERGVIRGADFVEANGDARIALYEATHDSSNYIRISDYDSTTGVVEGTFEVTFVAGEDYRDRPRSRFPDTLRFTDGEFRVRPAIYDSTECLRYCKAPAPNRSN